MWGMILPRVPAPPASGQRRGGSERGDRHLPWWPTGPPTHRGMPMPYAREYYVKGRVLVGASLPAATKGIPRREPIPSLSEIGKRLADLRRRIAEVAQTVRQR